MINQVPDNPLANSGGIEGGARPPKLRSALDLMRRRIEKVERLTAEDTEANLTFARSIRDCEQATERERLRAAELIEAIIAKSMDMASKLADTERLDDPSKATERIEVVFKDRLPTRED